MLFYFTQIMNADSKLKEMHKQMTSVNEWVDDCLGLMAEYKEDMETEDLENFKKRAEVGKKKTYMVCDKHVIAKDLLEKNK